MDSKCPLNLLISIKITTRESFSVIDRGEVSPHPATLRNRNLFRDFFPVVTDRTPGKGV